MCKFEEWEVKEPWELKKFRPLNLKTIQFSYNLAMLVLVSQPFGDVMSCRLP